VPGPAIPLSALQLKEHAFTNIRVVAVQGGSPAAEPALHPTLWFARVANTLNQWRLMLTVKLASADVAKPFLYHLEIQIQGIVEMTGEMLEDRREQLALVNGFSILYGAAREMLLTITARCAYGAVSLPTLSFAELVAEAKRRTSEAQKSPSVSGQRLQ